MSLIKIRAALENTVNGMTPALATAWENTKYTPAAGTAYQLVYLRATPENPNWGRTTRWNGVLYIRLMYPQSAGANAITARAELILTAFARGTSHTKDTITCIIDETPEFNTEGNDGDRFCGLVKAKFYTNLI
jgi:hypothetical protein